MAPTENGEDKIGKFNTVLLTNAIINTVNKLNS